MAPTTRRGECSAYSSQFNHKLAEVWGCDGPKCSKDKFVCNGRHLQENLLKSLLASMFLPSLRQTIPLELQPTHLVSSQSMEGLHAGTQSWRKQVRCVRPVGVLLNTLEQTARL